MPILPKHSPELMRNLAEYSETFLGMSVNQILQKLTSDKDLKFLDRGMESVILEPQNPNDRNILVSVDYSQHSPERQKRLFFTRRILSVLFPHNFPKFYLTSGAENDQKEKLKVPSMAIREKISQPQNFSEKDIKFNFQTVKDTCEELGIQAMWDDEKPKDFKIGADGGQYYMDGFNPDYIKFSNPEKILAYMRDQNFSALDISLVEKSLQRLRSTKDTQTKPKLTTDNAGSPAKKLRYGDE